MHVPIPGCWYPHWDTGTLTKSPVPIPRCTNPHQTPQVPGAASPPAAHHSTRGRCCVRGGAAAVPGVADGGGGSGGDEEGGARRGGGALRRALRRGRLRSSSLPPPPPPPPRCHRRLPAHAARCRARRNAGLAGRAAPPAAPAARSAPLPGSPAPGAGERRSPVPAGCMDRSSLLQLIQEQVRAEGGGLRGGVGAPEGGSVVPRAPEPRARGAAEAAQLSSLVASPGIPEGRRGAERRGRWMDPPGPDNPAAGSEPRDLIAGAALLRSAGQDPAPPRYRSVRPGPAARHLPAAPAVRPDPPRAEPAASPRAGRGFTGGSAMPLSPPGCRRDLGRVPRSLLGTAVPGSLRCPAAFRHGAAPRWGPPGVVCGEMPPNHQ